MSAWKPSCPRYEGRPAAASTGATSRWDSGDSGWSWSAKDRDEEPWGAAGGESGVSRDGARGDSDPWWDRPVADPWRSNGSMVW